MDDPLLREQIKSMFSEEQLNIAKSELESLVTRIVNSSTTQEEILV